MAKREYVKGAARFEIEYTKELRDKIAYADGDNINLGKEEHEVSEVRVYVNGKLVESAWNIRKLIPGYDNEKLIEAGNTHIIGNKVTLGPETAEILLNLYAECKIEGTTVEVKELEKSEEIKNIENKKELANKIIEEANMIINNGGEIRTGAQEKEWRKAYNNIVNEGGEGYIPHNPTTEEVEWAKSILAK